MKTRQPKFIRADHGAVASFSQSRPTPYAADSVSHGSSCALTLVARTMAKTARFTLKRTMILGLQQLESSLARQTAFLTPPLAHCSSLRNEEHF